MSHLRHGIDYVIGRDGEPVYAWDVLDNDEPDEPDCIDDYDPYLDTEDLWTRDAIIAMLILACSDQGQPNESPF